MTASTPDQIRVDAEVDAQRLTAQAGYLRAKGDEAEALGRMSAVAEAVDAAMQDLERFGADVPDFQADGKQPYYGRASELLAAASDVRQGAAKAAQVAERAAA